MVKDFRSMSHQVRARICGSLVKGYDRKKRMTHDNEVSKKDDAEKLRPFPN